MYYTPGLFASADVAGLPMFAGKSSQGWNLVQIFKLDGDNGFNSMTYLD